MRNEVRYMPNFMSFLAFSLLAIFTPGPNNIMALL
jgi:threonine/homoserine/homoserine lactone efflux protein